MSDQFELHIPPVPTDDILRDKIKQVELDIIAAEARGDLVTKETLYRERKRLKGLIYRANRPEAGGVF